MAPAGRRVLRGCLLAAGGTAALLIVAGGALAIWMWSSERMAAGRAQAFCDKVQLGEAIAEVEQRAKARDVLASENPQSGFDSFRWASWGRHECRVDYAGGRVTGKRVVSEAYD
jgi:hypothetical protein